MDISRLSLSHVRPVYDAVRQELSDHDRLPQIRGATDAIIALGGSPNFRDDYSKRSVLFVGIEIARRFLFADRRDLSGLQLASNYGPYLHYLKDKTDIKGISGVDINPFAVRYAKNIGSPVCEGDARSLTTSERSLDVVITHHFLDPNYIPVPVWVFQNEVHRVLKPGAYHISDLEVDNWDPYDLKRIRNFSYQRFAEDVRAEISALRNLYVFLPLA